MPDDGDMAPDFTLKDQNDESITLSSLRGNRALIFFYPKADTSGCTLEASGFRDAYDQFVEQGVIILGISPDQVKSQNKFASKYGLPMKLLADEDHSVALKYGVWVEKNMYGRKYMGVDRTTFLIAPDGKIEHVYHKVKPDGHAQQILATLIDSKDQ